MKITAIGVNSAFATGGYQQAVPMEEACELAWKIACAKGAEKVYTKEAIAAEFKKMSRRLYTPRWQANFLLEFDMPGKKGKSPYRLLIDIGGDARHALKAIDLTSFDIDGVYISHPHNDHIGGMEYMGLTTLFNPFYTPQKKAWLGEQFIADKLFLEHKKWPHPPPEAKPDLFVHRKVLDPLKMAVGPGLDTVQGVPHVRLETYFDIQLIGKQKDGQTKSTFFQDGNDEWEMTPIFAMHVISSSEEMASYGVILQHSNGYNVLMPTDTQHMIPAQLQGHYLRADRIYMDCETSQFPSGVHPHISHLIGKLDPKIQKKCLLYHYDSYPEVPPDMFYGILNTGDSHMYPEYA